jgi:hypothetical protein
MLAVPCHPLLILNHSAPHTGMVFSVFFLNSISFFIKKLLIGLRTLWDTLFYCIVHHAAVSSLAAHYTNLGPD